METSLAYSLISHAIDSLRVPGGYLIVGDVKGNSIELADMILAKLFPEHPEQVKAHSHPDIAWLEPEGKSSTIKTDMVRDRIVTPLETTSFSGGWKVGVIVGADRMQTAGANVFLKSLEEPTPKTLYLLLTDRPGSVLPTIISRCQRIDLAPPSGLLEGEARENVEAVFAPGALSGLFEKCRAAKYLTTLLGDLRDEAEDEDSPLVRKAFYSTILSIARGWMVEGKLERHLAFRNIDAIEEAYRRSEKHVPEESVLSFMLDKMTIPGQ